MTTPNDEAWAIEEFGCFLGCPVVMIETLRALLADPANDEKPFRALFGEALEVTVDGTELFGEDVDFQAVDRRRRQRQE